MNADHTTRNTGIFILAFLGVFSLVLIVLAAIAANTLWMVIAGIVLFAGVVAWLVSFIVHQYVLWINARVKAQEVHDNFVLSMAKVGLLSDGSGGFAPIQQKQIAAPAPKKETAPADPRKQLLIELCLMTIRSDKYGPASRRLMTADDAQEISKTRGGAFADRNKWADASHYAQENYLVYEKRGGTEQGLMVDSKRTGGTTIADLMSALMRNPILDSAVDALPGVDR